MRRSATPLGCVPRHDLVRQLMVRVQQGKPRDGTWTPYPEPGRWVLVAVLLALAAVLVWLSFRLREPLRTRVPGRLATATMLVTWGLSIVAFLVCLSVYVAQEHQVHLVHPDPPTPILPVTLTAMVVTFLVVGVGAPRGQPRRLLGAVAGALAGPMIFEFPFDLIVMWRTYPPVPPHPGLYRALFFLPLFMVEITTLWLVTLSPRAAVRPATCACLAAMFAVFAGWAIAGFGFPDAPVPFAMNVVSKLLAFATAASFLTGGRRAMPGTPERDRGH